jgi:hypothetical protein
MGNTGLQINIRNCVVVHFFKNKSQTSLKKEALPQINGVLLEQLTASQLLKTSVAFYNN